LVNRAIAIHYFTKDNAIAILKALGGAISFNVRWKQSSVSTSNSLNYLPITLPRSPQEFHSRLHQLGQTSHRSATTEHIDLRTLGK
jgi:hypothetical protein